MAWRASAVVSFVASSTACRGGGNVPDAHGPSESSPSATDAAAAPSTDAGLAASNGGVSGADLPRIAPVLDDPRLAAVRERERVRDWLAAARAMDDARRAQVLSAADECAWSYVAGRLHSAAASVSDAATAFDRVSASERSASDAGTSSCALAGYALLRAGQAYQRLGRADEAIARLRAVPDDVATRDEAKLSLAEALSAKGDRTAAVAIWRTALAASASGGRWAETAARLAAALLDGADGTAETRAKEAFDLATRVVVEAPKLADPLGAPALRARAFALLRASGATPSDALSPAERARQAQAWLDAAEATKALATADAVLATFPKPATLGHDVACRAAVTRAQAMTRAKAVSADPWGEAIARCEGEEPFVTALYLGGKSSHSARRLDEAIVRFAKVEQLFPKHRLADDARFQGALSVQESGDEARFVTMMSTLPDAYPEGDMRTEALFRVGFMRFARGELELAKAPLDRTMAIAPTDHHWGTAGRAAYFRARIAHLTGDLPDAKRRYAAVVSEHPLAYAMTQAYARLGALDVGAARATLEAAIAKEPSGAFYTKEHAELRGAPFERAIRLLEVGEVEAARRELAAAGMLGDKADDELVWTSAYLFDRAGAPEIGHAFARTRVTDFLAHYPAGRWRVAWEAAFPRAFDAIVAKASEAGGIPAPLTWAIMREESGFHAEAKSASNAHGLMQLLPGTAHDVARGTGLPSDEVSLHDPQVNIPLGAKLLGSLRRMYTVNPALAIAAYNSGSGNVRRWLDARGGADFDVWVEQIPFDETRGYVKRVLASEMAYAFLYARPVLDELLAIPTQVRRSGG